MSHNGKNEEMGIRFMNAFEEKMMERREGREEGRVRKEGKLAAQQDIVRKMLEMGMKLEVIAEATGLTEAEIKELNK